VRNGRFPGAAGEKIFRSSRRLRTTRAPTARGVARADAFARGGGFPDVFFASSFSSRSPRRFRTSSRAIADASRRRRPLHFFSQGC
jgi:hypothetical protein